MSKRSKKSLAVIFSLALLVGSAQPFSLAEKSIYAADTETEGSPVLVTLGDITYKIDPDYNTASVFASADDVSDVSLAAKIKNKYVLTDIGYITFKDRSDLETITFPDSIKTISSFAFQGCRNLENVELPDDVIRIGEGAFASCMGFTEFTFPDGVDLLDTSVLGYCKNLETVKLPSSLKEIRSYAFQKDAKLKEIEIPDKVETILTLAFTGCKSLESIELPDSLTYLGSYCFSECESLKSVKLSENIPAILARTFYGCSSLESIEIPESITLIEENAFFGCTSMKEITIPATVEKIENMAFGYQIGGGSRQFDPIEGFVINGYKGTAAEKYAKENKIKFNCLDDASASYDPANAAEETTTEATKATEESKVTEVTDVTGENVSTDVSEDIGDIEVLAGDFDGDGAVSVTDLDKSIKALLSADKLTAAQQKALDFDGNGSISIIDIIKLKNLLIEG